MRKWSVKVVLLDKDKKEHPANCFTKVVFQLHPSFDNPVQSKYAPHSPRGRILPCAKQIISPRTAFTNPPFTCENEGWGEFEMQIELYYTDKSGKITIPHDLNFQQNRYEDEHVVTFKNPSQNLQQILRETGPLPSDEDRRNRKAEGTVKKQKKPFDVEKMAQALVKLEEDDLLQVIQMIHDHKSEETYIQNNLDGMNTAQHLRAPFQAVADMEQCIADRRVI